METMFSETSVRTSATRYKEAESILNTQLKLSKLQSLPDYHLADEMKEDESGHVARTGRRIIHTTFSMKARNKGTIMKTWSRWNDIIKVNLKDVRLVWTGCISLRRTPVSVSNAITC
jgi:hypothetical protein